MIFNPRWQLSLGILLASGLVFLQSCSNKPAVSKPEAAQVAMPQMPPVPVTVGAASLKTVPVQVRVIGTGEAFSTINVKSQVEGRMESVHFQEGQDVKKGDLLFSIDPRPFEAAVQQAEANLARDQALLKNAKAQAQRYDALFKAGIVSKDQYDQFSTNAASLEATVRADQAALETGKIQLGYCSIYAAIDGRTGNLMVHPGNTVKSGDATLVVINQISPIYVDFSVPEQNLLEVKKYQAQGNLPVQAIVPQEENHPEEGKVTFINNTVDNTTGTILLKGTFPNPDRRLWPGQFVNVVLTLTAMHDAVVVPSAAVQTGQQGQYVFVVKGDNSVEIRPVVPGTVLGGDEVIEKGIQSGERVVTDGQLMLYPGARALIRNASPSRGQP
jgi:multidrug efflux system membrane fusion protein